jgi:flagellar hook protein FlgE
MSLYGALSAGVSGMNAQSNDLALISDNIANINTIGYKGSFGEFSTLVTQQSLPNSYAAGGVQFNRIGQFGNQGILQSTSSPTDMAVSGKGFFVVNTNAGSANSSQLLFTRAGSFTTDSQGNLVNTAGYYLEGWPTDASGTPTTSNTSVLSNLQTVNISGVSGSATPTTNIALGINLPAADDSGSSHTTNVEVFDSLGVAHDVAFDWTKSTVNQWNFSTQVPTGASMIVALNSSGQPSFAQGQLSFTGQPADGDSVTIGGTTYEFDSNSAVTAGNTAVSIGSTLALTIGNLATAANDPRVVAGSTALTVTQSSASAALTVDPNSSAISQTAIGPFTLPVLTAYGSGQVSFSGQPVDGDTISIGGTTYEFNSAGGVTAGNTAVTIGGTLATTLSSLATAVNDPRVTATSGGLQILQSASGGALAVTPGSSAITTGAFTVPSAPPAVAFDGSGTPASFNVSSLSVGGWLSGAADSSIGLNLGSIGGTSGLTQFSSNYTVNSVNQDGVQFGSFSGVSISDTGIVTANFDNGLSRAIFKIPLVTFANPDGLITQNGNAFLATDSSGVPLLGSAKTGGVGSIAAGSLETSTVDLGTEFTNMIIAQRAYSANTKIITTVDQMLQELVQLKQG